MPLDQSIIQAGAPPSLSAQDFENQITGPATQRLKLQSAQTEEQTRDLALKQAQAQTDAQKALDGALQKYTKQNDDGTYTTDWDGIHGSLAQQGLGPAAIKADAMHSDALDNAFKVRRNQLDQDTMATHALNASLGAITPIDWQSDPTYVAAQVGANKVATQQAVNVALHVGKISPQMAAYIQNELNTTGYTPAVEQQVNSIRATGLNAEEQLKNFQQQFQDNHARALAGPQVDEAKAKSLGEWTALASKAISNTANQEDYARAFKALRQQGVPDSVLAAYPLEWTADLPAKALRMAMNPKDVATAGKNTAAEIKTELANAVTSFNAAKPTDQPAYDAWFKAQPASVQAFLPAEYSDDVASQVAGLGQKTTKAAALKISPEITAELFALGVKDPSMATPNQMAQALKADTARKIAARPVTNNNLVTPESRDATAGMIADYQAAPPSGLALSRAEGQNLMAAIKKINPAYQQSQYPIFQDTEKAFTSGVPATKANALNTMMGHLSVLDQATDLLHNSDIPALNKIANFVGAQIGGDATTTYKAIVHRLAPEITSAYVVSGGTQGERGTNESDFDPGLGLNQIKSNIGVSAQLADSKIKALQDQYKRGTYGRGQQKLISDEAESARQRLAGQSPVGKATPKIGEIRQGYKFNGGDPGKPENWVKQ